MVGLKGKDKEVLSGLKTESRNPRTLDLDLMSVGELLTVMNEEDKNVIEAVKQVLPQVRETVEAVIRALNQGGRLVYAGAGTSGRLGILDAVECLPTFSTTDEVVGIIAGGEKAFVRAQEGAEDSKEEARKDLEHLKVDERDVVVALSASGRTPYCIGALEYAREAGACCVGLSCNRPAELSAYSDIAIEVDAGPEILTGSTRLKAGTAEKMILNMITTSVMIQLGRVKGNKMVNMQLSNQKLVDRGTRMIVEELGLDYDQAKALLLMHGSVKKAVDAYKAGQ